MSTSSQVWAIIVAAGESRRMNGVDKMWAILGGKPVLAWTVEVFQNSDLVNGIIIVTNEKNLEPVRQLAVERKWTKVEWVCPGGQRRQDSVAAGLAHAESAEWVMVQDGARPFVTSKIIQDGLEVARETGAAIAAVPITDTIKMADKDLVIKQTLPRQDLWAVQTPQVFRFAIIKEAYRRITGDVTDDASLVEQLGYKVKLYPGSYDNIKITTPRDLALAECLIKEHGY